jgi:Protein of unknown function (DUF3592)
VFALVLISIMVGTVMSTIIPEWKANNRYVQAPCVVLDKKLDSQQFDQVVKGQPGVQKIESYRPRINIRYPVGEKKFDVWAYDVAVNTYSGDRNAAQSIVDRFTVGSTYPCWYDPDRPENVVLVRTQSWAIYLTLAVMLVPLALCAAGMFLGWTISKLGRKTPDGKFVEPPLWLRRVAKSVYDPDFDPPQLGDPLATSIDRTILRARAPGDGGRPRRLVVIDPDRLEYRPAIRDFVELLVFFCAGLAMCFNRVVAAVPFVNLTIGSPTRLLLILVPILLAVVFAVYRTTPVVFDKRVGFFWRGRKVPGEIGDETIPKHAVDLREIHALQIIYTFVRSGDRKIEVHHLNLILNDGSRRKVAFGERFKIRRDAARLAEFLGKPVWDAT